MIHCNSLILHSFNYCYTYVDSFDNIVKEAMMETDEVDDVKRHGFGGGQAISVANNVCLNRCAHGCCSCVRGRCIRCCIDEEPQAMPSN